QNVEPAYRQLIALLLEPTSGKDQPSPTAIKEALRYFQSFQAAEIETLFICSLQGDKNRSSIDEFIKDKQLNAVTIYPIVLRDKIGVIINLPSLEEPLYYVSSEWVSEKMVWETKKQTRRRGDAGTRRMEIPTKISFTRSEYPNLLDYIDEQVWNLTDNAQTITIIKEAAQNLYNLLIGSAAQEQLTNHFANSTEKTLVFIPDSPLTDIPLAALHDGDKYLSEEYGVVLSTGWLLKNGKPFQDVKLDSLIVAVEKPQFGDFEQLKSLEDEVDHIKKLLNKTRVFFDQKEEFTKEKLEDNINQSSYNVIHLATHGQFSSDLSQTFIAAPEAKIYINELDRILLSENRKNYQTLDLLVFSACDTASDDKRAALGIAGAAVKVGASSTLATLWSVDDGFTAEFMKHFYEELIKSKTSRIEALRRTQKYFLDDRGVPGNGRRPSDWAAYTLVGDWR
ncbi:MAG: CHAT domain-containing protein, partial [Symploca sp. SIO3E6]|nr:CHAT domain-containing protein [Caldora sp. SIO3E6]